MGEPWGFTCEFRDTNARMHVREAPAPFDINPYPRRSRYEQREFECFQTTITIRENDDIERTRTGED
jgi:hypothetical protein